jgi:hypothetical protein
MLILLPILSIDSLTWLALSRIFGKKNYKELSFSKTSFKVTSVLTTWIGGTPSKLSIKVHASRAGVPRKLPPTSIVLKTRPVIEPMRSSVQVFTGQTIGSPVHCLVF